MDCKVCTDRPHGALPRWFKGSHCYDCCTSWTGVTAAHTLCCHRTFSSNGAADFHLRRGRCTDPATLPRFEAVVRADGNTYWTLSTGSTGVGSQGISDAKALEVVR